MNKSIIFLIVLSALIFSCNNSQTTTNEQTDVPGKNALAIQSEKRNSDIIVLKETGKTIDDFQLQSQVKMNDAAISWKEFYKQHEKRPQIFLINNSNDTLLTCLEGTTIRIRPNTFVSELTGEPVSGNIKIIVTEYYKLSDMLLANLTTTAGNSILETGGMIYIAAVSDNGHCKIKDGQKIEIGFPAKVKKDDMQLFNGEWENNVINWQVVSNSFDLNKIYTSAEVQPQFTGVDQEATQYINKNIRYPQKALELGIQGTVYVQFIVDRDGIVRDAVVLRGIHPDCDREALNAASQFLISRPAQINGENVNVRYTLPVVFRLAGGVSNSKDIQKDFEEAYNDSTIHTAYASQISSYLFSAAQLGWINVDKIINLKGERVDLLVKLGKKSESDVKIIFHSMKSIISSIPAKENHVFNNIPKGEKITIVVIKNIGNKPHLAIKETITSTQTETDFTFQPITMETLKSEMKKLDSLNL